VIGRVLAEMRGFASAN